MDDATKDAFCMDVKWVIEQIPRNDRTHGNPDKNDWHVKDRFSVGDKFANGDRFVKLVGLNRLAIASTFGHPKQHLQSQRSNNSHTKLNSTIFLPAHVVLIQLGLPGSQSSRNHKNRTPIALRVLKSLDGDDGADLRGVLQNHFNDPDPARHFVKSVLAELSKANSATQPRLGVGK